MVGGRICQAAHACRADGTADLGKYLSSLAAGVDDVLVNAITAIGQIPITQLRQTRSQNLIDWP